MSKHMPVHTEHGIVPVPALNSHSVLVVDPPLAYGSDTGRTRTAEHHYGTIGNGGKEINRKTGAGVERMIDLYARGRHERFDACGNQAEAA